VGEVSTIGLDLAKQAFHVHGAESAGRPLFSRNISRAKLEPSEDDFLDGLAVDALRACEASAWALVATLGRKQTSLKSDSLSCSPPAVPQADV
jgi:hypothetical protein